MASDEPADVCGVTGQGHRTGPSKVRGPAMPHPDAESEDPSLTYEYTDRSLMVFGPKNPVRKACLFVIRTKAFDRGVILLILLNCVFLCMGNPICNKMNLAEVMNSTKCDEAARDTYMFLEHAELVLNILFSIESVFKIIGMGMACGKHSYLRSPWNVLDFSVVLIGSVRGGGGGGGVWACVRVPAVEVGVGVNGTRLTRAASGFIAGEGARAGWVGGGEIEG